MPNDVVVGVDKVVSSFEDGAVSMPLRRVRWMAACGEEWRVIDDEDELATLTRWDDGVANSPAIL